MALFITISARSQQSEVYSDPGNNFRKAVDLYNKEVYSGAQAIFREITSLDPANYPSMVADARFFDAMCDAELQHDNASEKITAFINDYPEHPQSKLAHFYLGRIYFNEGKYRDAMNSFREVRPAQLEKGWLPEYYYKTGYCYLKMNQPGKAKTYLRNAASSGSEYSVEAEYYLAHIAYLEGNYTEAREYFEKLRDDRTYGKDVQLYLLHIDYYLGNYDRILETGPQIVEEATYKTKPEVSRIVGDAYFQYNEYEKALPYLETYYRSSRRSIDRKEHYQLAFTYLKNGMHGDAIGHFQKATGPNDSLTQQSYYFLGICYLETGEKKFAGNAFLSAYKSGIDPEISEESLFNYAKLSIESASTTFNEAVSLLEEYIEKNPYSERKSEAYNLLVDLYINSSDYERALESIRNIDNKTPAIEKAYQQVAFFRAVELFSVNEFAEAIELFKVAAGFDHIPELRARAKYWAGESFYRIDNFWGAIKYFGDFLNDRYAKNTEEYARAHYNLGYTHFKRKEYDKAISQFRAFLKEEGRAEERLVQDAYLRIADAYFINKRYRDAIENYEKATQYGKSGADYALFQKASSEGALGNFRDKINTLKLLDRSFPSSIYNDDALYEIATTYLIINDQPSALNHFDELVKEHPKSSFAIKSLMRSGLIYYNASQYQPAISTFKAVIEKYPGSPESKEALISLRKVYVETGNVNDYYDYASQFSFADVSANERDSVTWSVAEMKYLEGKCDEAIKGFNKYLNDFPQGFYSANAHFYMAECHFKNDRTGQALENYLEVIERPAGQFTETALVRVAGIFLGRKEHEKALQYFEELEQMASYPENKAYARSGMMRCALELGRPREVVEAGKELLASEGITSELVNEVHITLARAYFQLDETENALEEYKTVKELVSNEWAAEAQYHIALLQFSKGEYDTAEESIFELAEKYGAYDYWIAKGFILLSDIYVEKDNLFQARQTLQSIIDNYTGPELGETARQKIRKIEEIENQSTGETGSNEEQY